MQKPDLVLELENAGWPVLLVEPSGAVCWANCAAIGLFGPVFDGPNASLEAIWPSGHRATPEQFLAQAERSPSLLERLNLREKTGGSVSCVVSACSFTRNERKQFVLQFLTAPVLELVAPAPAPSATSESTMIHKQRLDRALQLTRTISLDFNNALTSILGHTSLILGKMEPDHPWRSSLVEVEKSAAKAAEIASDLGMFSRAEKEAREHTAGNLNKLVEKAVEHFRRSTGNSPINWVFQSERKLFAAKLDEGRLQQAIGKILENSVEAIKDSGQVTLQTRNVELTEEARDRDVKLAPGAYVCLEISDNGCGIQQRVLSRIFEPFFTTKDSAKHRGLGLPWVYGIVANHGGGVAISSQPGVGTSVRVYLPAEKRIIPNELPAGALKGEHTILVVDDEDLLLTTGRAILGDHGYQVLTASSGQQALDLIARQGKPVDLAIIDVVMPAMSGRELAGHIQRLSPSTQTLYTSGYVGPGSGNPENGGSFLQKPFTTQELLVKVKQVLMAHQSPLVE
jgi:signal transduction histidine kinase